MAESEDITLSVDPSRANPVRLDLYVAENLSHLSRSRIKKLIDEGQIFVNGRRAKAGTKLKGGETVSISIPPDKPLELTAEDRELDVVYEDSHLLVVNKPPGMVVHPGAGIREGTLVNYLLSHCGDSLSGISGILRPGIVHRLDKDTSGLIVVAKADRAHRHLAKQIKDRKAGRIYLALVDGVMAKDSGTVDRPLGRHPVRRKEITVIETGKPAVTHFEVQKRFTAYTFVKLKLETGRTHQIRVHLASLGHPVVGDLVYNKRKSGTESARKKLGIKGHCLHAKTLSFVHPETGALLEFEAPLPQDFQRLVDSL